MNLKILYEDNHLVVVYKPKGILAQKDYTNEDDMLSFIKQYIKIKFNKPNEAFIGLVHRLDRNTEGIMVFARTSKAARRLSESIKNNEFHKKYYAIVEGVFHKKEDTLVHLLGKNEQDKKAYLSENGKEAILKYHVKKEIEYHNQILALVDIELLTGRFHQIRCQMSLINHPLYQDKKYNMNSKISDYYLCAYCLSFLHPVTKLKLNFEITPQGELFDKFFN